MLFIHPTSGFISIHHIGLAWQSFHTYPHHDLRMHIDIECEVKCYTWCVYSRTHPSEAEKKKRNPR